MSLPKNGFTATVLLSFVAFVLLQNWVCAGEAVHPACRVKVLLRRGAVFDAVVQDRELLGLLEKKETPDLAGFDPDRRLVLYYIQGLNGTMTVTLGEVASLQRLRLLDKGGLEALRSGIRKRIAVLLEREQKRLARLKAEREALRKAEAEAAKEAAERAAAAKAAPPTLEDLPWIKRFPPEEGWGPEKKQALYRRSMVVGVFPNAEERAFLDHFEEWTKEYATWKKLKAQEEQAAQEAGKKAASTDQGGAEGAPGASTPPPAGGEPKAGEKKKEGEEKMEEKPPSTPAKKGGGG